MPDLDDTARGEVRRTVHRVVEKLLHTPTVRVKELTSDGHGEDYAAALRELFDLDPHTVAAVSSPPASSSLDDTDAASEASGDPAASHASSSAPPF